MQAVFLYFEPATGSFLQMHKMHGNKKTPETTFQSFPVLTIYNNSDRLSKFALCQFC